MDGARPAVRHICLGAVRITSYPIGKAGLSYDVRNTGSL